jgi:hypothetical protein
VCGEGVAAVAPADRRGGALGCGVSSPRRPPMSECGRVGWQRSADFHALGQIGDVAHF